jgi:SAM-dependent methyltransferase
MIFSVGTTQPIAPVCGKRTMFPYVEPKRGVRPEEAAFYHRLDFPELNGRKWLWDLREQEAAYLGNFDFAGKRVLEIGTANGALCFWMEKQGAEVVAVDLSPDVTRTSWDTLLMPDDDPAAVSAQMAKGIQRLNNGFWYGHEKFSSEARLVHATAYAVPVEVGIFDVVTLCAVLQHLRDPLGALEKAVQFTRNAVIIVDQVPSSLTKEELQLPLARFMPKASDRTSHGGWTWWDITPELYFQYLKLKGFEVSSYSTGTYQQVSQPCEVFTIVAER